MIRGHGVIGYPLAYLLASLRKLEDSFDVFLEPFEIGLGDTYQLHHLEAIGCLLVSTERNEAISRFEKAVPYSEAVERSRILCDVSPPSVAETRIKEYKSPFYSGIQHFIAQGSEHSFGPQLLMPANKDLLEDPPRFFHIGTCNSHALYAILELFSEGSLIKLNENLSDVDFVILRRDADLAKSGPHLAGPLIGLPSCEDGTHHAFYLKEVLKEKGFRVPVSSSSVTINSPFFHLIRFRLQTKKLFSLDLVREQILSGESISYTYLSSAASVFSHARDRGMLGRIWSRALFFLSALEVNGAEVRGYAATPGDSSVVLPTITAVLECLELEVSDRSRDFLKSVFLRQI